jgi:hypothetical protein
MQDGYLNIIPQMLLMKEQVSWNSSFWAQNLFGVKSIKCWKYSIKIFVFISITSSISTGVCVSILSSRSAQWVNGHRYQLLELDRILSWEDSSSFASSLGGYLVTFNSPNETGFLLSTFGILPSNVWAGCFQNKSSPTFSEPLGGWEWVTNEPFINAPWGGGEPNHHGGKPEDYCLSYKEYSMNDFPNVPFDPCCCCQFTLVEFNPLITEPPLCQLL